jgi:hypothetical protein
MGYLYILEPILFIRELPSLENGYMYIKSIFTVSYVVLTTICGQLQQILD